MKKYVLLLLGGLLLLVIGDFIIGSTLKHFYFNTSSGLLHSATYSINETEADILIFGSSRAIHHYDTKIIEENTGLSAYNTGRPGNFIFYQTALLNSIVKRHTPKQIILDFSGTFKFRQEDYDRISSLLPYYSSHIELRDIIHLKSPFEKYKLKSKIYPFNSLLTTIAVGNLNFNETRKGNSGTYNGYVPRNGKWKSDIVEKETPTKYEIDEVKLGIFKEFLELSKQRSIPLLVVYSPVYYKYDKNYSVEVCKDVCEEYNVPFIDFSKDIEFLENKELFNDREHLNKDGAKLLTEKVLKEIKNQEKVKKNSTLENCFIIHAP